MPAVITTIEKADLPENATLELFSSSEGRPFRIRLIDNDAGEVAGAIQMFPTEAAAREVFDRTVGLARAAG